MSKNNKCNQTSAKKSNQKLRENFKIKSTWAKLGIISAEEFNQIPLNLNLKFLLLLIEIEPLEIIIL